MTGKKTFSVSLPINEVKRMGWQKGDDLMVRRLKNYIIIEKEDNEDVRNSRI